MNTPRPLRIGIVGLNFGRHILEQLKLDSIRPDFELAAVCDLDAAKAADYAGRYSVKAYSSLDDLLADPTIPVIGLFTGPVGRAQIIRKIIQAGKDIITTKPFETDPEAALAVLQEARRLGRVVHLNSPGPVPPDDIAQIMSWVSEYKLGAPVGARADVWASYREQADGTWYDDPQKCPVAPIFRLGIYLINDLVQLFGPVRDVQVLQSRLFTGRPTADNGQLNLLFENGALGNIFASFCVNDGDHYRNTLTLNFENGTIYRNAGPERAGSKSELSLVMNRENHRAIVARTTVNGTSGSYNWEAFARAVRGEKLASETTPEQVAAGIRIIQAMSGSATSLA
jgi:predicted dehydrogenase